VAADGATPSIPVERRLLPADGYGVAPHAPLSVAAGVAKPPVQWLRHAAIVFSVCLHAAIGSSMFDWSGSDDQFGTLSNKTDAISLSTEQTVVLESIETETVQTASAASAASQAGSVQSVDAVAQPLTEVKEAVEAAEPPPEAVDVAEVMPSAAIPTDDPLPVIRGSAPPDEVQETKAVQTSETVEQVKPAEIAAKDVSEEQDKKEDTEKKEKQVTAQAASRASAAGSTTSRASVAQAAVNGRVSASRGSVLTYAARIRTVLARHKPNGDGYSGTTRISFGLTMDGELSYAEIASSCGRDRLDQAALAAVRKAAPFGPAPSDVTVNELRFTIPFYFR
jgi:protein TonB